MAVQDKSKEAYKDSMHELFNSITRFYSLCLTKNGKVQIDVDMPKQETHESKPTKRIKHSRQINNSLDDDAALIKFCANVHVQRIQMEELMQVVTLSYKEAKNTLHDSHIS
jgi:hypothetical protein